MNKDKLPHLYKKFFDVLSKNDIHPKDKVDKKKLSMLLARRFHIKKGDMNKTLNEMRSMGMAKMKKGYVVFGGHTYFK